MPLDPVLVSDTRLWLVKAANDLRAAEIDLGAEPPLIEDALFHCQQAAEKALKAFLTFHNVTFRKTHNLEEIGEVCLTIDQSLKDMVDEAVPLTEYAWAFRYPGNILTADSTEVQTALKISRKLFCMILDRLPSETHP
jgi:HEPN domain-containing protein